MGKIKQLGPYSDFEQIGDDWITEVYKAKDSRDGRTVAIRMVGWLIADETERAWSLLSRETEKMRLLENPDVVTVYDVHKENNFLYVVMEYVEGPSLDRLMKRGKEFGLVRRLEVIRQVCAVLEGLHEHGVVHFGLSPKNVLVLADGSVKLAGFGMNAIEDCYDLEAPTFGSHWAYHSIDKFKAKLGPECDVDSVGMMLFELLTGKVPFPVLSKLSGSELLIPPSVPFSTEFDGIFRRAMPPKPDARKGEAPQVSVASGTGSPLDELLAAVYVVGCAGLGCVGHQVDG